MDKQNVNTTSSMKRKGDSSSSHYRISSGTEACERAVATKFVKWEVQPLETLCTCEAYLLRVKLNRGEAMSREEKDWLCEAVNSNTYFCTAVPVMGYRFDFFDVLKSTWSSNTDNGLNTTPLTERAYVSSTTDVSTRL